VAGTSRRGKYTGRKLICKIHAAHCISGYKSEVVYLSMEGQTLASEEILSENAIELLYQCLICVAKILLQNPRMSFRTGRFPCEQQNSFRMDPLQKEALREFINGGVCKIKTAAPNSHASVKTSRCSSRVALHLPLPPRGGAGPVGIVPGLQKNSEAFAVAHVWPSPSVHL